MRYVVCVADMKIAAGADDSIITHALGSCLGITVYDPQVRVGGMFHVMLPSSSVNPDKAEIAFKVKGMSLKGGVEVKDSSIDMELEVPFMLKPFQGKAVSVIEGEIKKWIGKADEL